MLDQLIHYPALPTVPPGSDWSFHVPALPCLPGPASREAILILRPPHHQQPGDYPDFFLLNKDRDNMLNYCYRLYNVIQKYTSDIFPSWYIQKCQIMQDWLYIILPARYLLQNYTAHRPHFDCQTITINQSESDHTSWYYNRYNVLDTGLK